MTITSMHNTISEVFSTPLFEIGQAVRFRGNAGWPHSSAGIYHVTGTRPGEGDTLQYRIRSDDESHERVVAQKDLQPADIQRTDGSETLMEKTFGARAKR